MSAAILGTLALTSAVCANFILSVPDDIEPPFYLSGAVRTS
jgi:hypothetical protein